MQRLWFVFLLVVAANAVTPASAANIDLSRAVVVIREGELPAAEKVAPAILTEEIASRTGLDWTVTTDWPVTAEAIIALTVSSAAPSWRDRIPPAKPGSGSSNRPEGFSIRVREKSNGQPPIVFVTGNDSRGVMFGVGKLLRSVNWAKGKVQLAGDFHAELAPDVPLRGHQLGYRARANSWDAWTPAQFEQYIRELVIFGANAIENIPFEDSDRSVHMPIPREEMNMRMAEICIKYDVEYWHWVPVEFKLPDAAKGGNFLKQQEAFYRECPRIDGIFVPGGDPGDNAARDLIPYLREIGVILRRHHPRAAVWVSLQKFSAEDINDFYRFLDSEKPDWLGGVVMGPSSPPLGVTRERLPRNYKLRWYPDITHTVRCQYPVPWFDPAFGLTLGREPVNPRPLDYAAIYRAGYRDTDGFLTYSDGIHDDFNKNLWTQLGWQPDRDPRDCAVEYARYFFGGDLAEAGGDALLALETNWRGSLAANGSVDGTLLQWEKLAADLPQGKTPDWRFEMHLMRAYYDAYTRHRLIYETGLEREALAALGNASTAGIGVALKQAREILGRASTAPSHPEWYEKLDAFAESLFRRIGYQTRMERYHASGTERGVVMDFVNYPLNDRWWLEDEFDRIEKLPNDADKLRRIEEIRHWEKPTPGSFYDSVGDVSRSPRIPKLLDAANGSRLYPEFPIPSERWMGEKRRGLRLAWHTYLNRPPAMNYAGLDPKARYTVRLFAQRTSPLKIDGAAAKLIRKGGTYDEVQEQEFDVPAEAVADGRLELTWGRADETGADWRKRHYVCEVWVVKQATETERGPAGN